MADKTRVITDQGSWRQINTDNPFRELIAKIMSERLCVNFQAVKVIFKASEQTDKKYKSYQPKPCKLVDVIEVLNLMYPKTGLADRSGFSNGISKEIVNNLLDGNVGSKSEAYDNLMDNMLKVLQADEVQRAEAKKLFKALLETQSAEQDAPSKKDRHVKGAMTEKVVKNRADGNEGHSRGGKPNRKPAPPVTSPDAEE